MAALSIDQPHPGPGRSPGEAQPVAPPAGLGDPLAAVEELIRITTELSTERNLKVLLDKILRSARRLTCAEAGRIYVLDRTKRFLLPEVAQNDAVASQPGALRPVPLFKNDSCNTTDLCAYAAFTGKPIEIPDLYRYAGFDCTDIYEYDRLTSYRTAAILTAPMQDHQGITLGVLQLVNPRPGGELRPFDAAAQRIVAAFASQAAVAVENAQLIAEKQRLIEALDQDRRSLEQENLKLKQLIAREHPFREIIGESPPMRRVFALMDKVLNTDATVLILGETGTGKELIARAIHQHSARREGPFISQNCAALPEDLLESELFGYRRGAFTGATTDRKGLIEAADAGTLFLDEIGDMPLGLQAKILRVLQEGEVRPLGEVASRKVNVRVVAATHQDLQALMREGRFRQDLYYRLSVFPITLPPLRTRREDLLPLLEYFLGEFASLHGKPLTGYAPSALELLLSYDYPGNIRELKNLVERAVIMAGEETQLGDEHFTELQGQARLTDAHESDLSIPLPELVRRYEALLIQKQLEAHHWNQTRTAEVLGIPRRTLVEKISRYHLQRGP